MASLKKPKVQPLPPDSDEDLEEVEMLNTQPSTGSGLAAAVAVATAVATAVTTPTPPSGSGDKTPSSADQGDTGTNKGDGENEEEQQNGDGKDEASANANSVDGEPDGTKAGEKRSRGRRFLVRTRRTSLSRSAKKPDTSYKEVLAVPVMYYESPPKKKAKKRATRKSPSKKPSSPEPDSVASMDTTEAAPTTPIARVIATRNPAVNGGAPVIHVGENGAATPSTPASKPTKAKKVFFNHCIVQETIWKALTDLGWTTTKPYKTQRNYHPPPKPDGERVRVFDSIGRVMDYVRVDPEWRDNERVQEALAEYEKVTGDVGGSTSFNTKNKGLGTPRHKRKLMGHDFHEPSFNNSLLKVLLQQGWKVRKHKGRKLFIKGTKTPGNNATEAEAAAKKAADEKAQKEAAAAAAEATPGTSSIISDAARAAAAANDIVNKHIDKNSVLTAIPAVAADAKKAKEDEVAAAAASTAAVKDAAHSDVVPAVAQEKEEEIEEISEEQLTGKLGVDYFDNGVDVLRFIMGDDLRFQPEIKVFGLDGYIKLFDEHINEQKRQRDALEKDADGLMKPQSGLNKPRPHKFSNPIMQETVWKILSELGWTTARRKNSSQRNYYPPRDCGSRRAVYQTITAVLDYIRTDMEWMLNERVQVALKEYDRRLYASFGRRAALRGLIHPPDTTHPGALNTTQMGMANGQAIMVVDSPITPAGAAPVGAANSTVRNAIADVRATASLGHAMGGAVPGVVPQHKLPVTTVAPTALIPNTVVARPATTPVVQAPMVGVPVAMAVPVPAAAPAPAPIVAPMPVVQPTATAAPAMNGVATVPPPVVAGIVTVTGTSNTAVAPPTAAAPPAATTTVPVGAGMPVTAVATGTTPTPMSTPTIATTTTNTTVAAATTPTVAAVAAAPPVTKAPTPATAIETVPAPTVATTPTVPTVTAALPVAKAPTPTAAIETAPAPTVATTAPAEAAVAKTLVKESEVATPQATVPVPTTGPVNAAVPTAGGLVEDSGDESSI